MLYATTTWPIVSTSPATEALEFIFWRGAYSDRAFMNPPKLILLDLGLPKVQGLEVLRIIKMDERTKAIPVFILTSSKEEADLVDSYQIGFNSYVQKPGNFSRFRETVKQLGLRWLLVKDPRLSNANRSENSSRHQ